MKKSAVFVLLVASLFTCQDSFQKANVEVAASLRDVGRQITQAEADRWTSRAANNLSRQQSLTFNISKDNLKLLVSAVDEYDGLFFYHGLELEEQHVFVIPYKTDLKFWENNIAVDANFDKQLDAAIAKTWFELFKATHPDGPWSHFFGRTLIESILAKSDLERIEIRPAVNDRGDHLLLLYAWSIDVSNGRVKGQADVYDHSNPCPPYCP
jgi:hypothetical protein